MLIQNHIFYTQVKFLQILAVFEAECRYCKIVYAIDINVNVFKEIHHLCYKFFLLSLK